MYKNKQLTGLPLFSGKFLESAREFKDGHGKLGEKAN